jgi:hypothetical protein
MRPETIHAVPRDDAVLEWVFTSAFIRGQPVDTGVSISVSRLVTFDTLPFCPSKPSQSLAKGFALAEPVISQLYNTNFSKNFKQQGKFARQTVSDCAILVASA